LGKSPFKNLSFSRRHFLGDLAQDLGDYGKQYLEHSSFVFGELLLGLTQIKLQLSNMRARSVVVPQVDLPVPAEPGCSDSLKTFSELDLRVVVQMAAPNKRRADFLQPSDRFFRRGLDQVQVDRSISGVFSPRVVVHDWE
jgi:hypothetical protein